MEGEFVGKLAKQMVLTSEAAQERVWEAFALEEVATAPRSRQVFTSGALRRPRF